MDYENTIYHTANVFDTENITSSLFRQISWNSPIFLFSSNIMNIDRTCHNNDINQTMQFNDTNYICYMPYIS